MSNYTKSFTVDWTAARTGTGRTGTARTGTARTCYGQFGQFEAAQVVNVENMLLMSTC